MDSDSRLDEYAKGKDLPFILVSDRGRAIARAYEVGQERGRVQRATFVVERGGLIRNAFRHELLIPLHVTQVVTVLGRLPPAG